MITVLRLGHRIVRDQRITTHVALTARAFGADSVIISGEKDDSVIEGVRKVCEEFGGHMDIQYVKNWKKVIGGFKGAKVHLTMYGVDIDDIAGELQARAAKEDMLIIVGGPKVPFEVYECADYNVAVGNQPHSEVAALAIALDRVVGPQGRKREFSGGLKRILPNQRGKTVIESP
ncbi:MAG: tRNA (cytidine(56)-2'-O)-methyltransferase [Candidatus Micrarchaeia archaeon]